MDATLARATVAAIALALLTSCATLFPVREYTRTVQVEVEVVAPPPINPLLHSTTNLTVGKYQLTEFERRAIREIFGPPVARWIENHTRVGKEKEFVGHLADAAAFFSPETDTVVLRQEPNKGDAKRFANLIHEVTHYWEFHQYKHPQPVDYAKLSTRNTYWIPDTWKNLNIEQEAEMVSLYAVLTYLFTRDTQQWRQWDTTYTRDDLPKIEEYMRREMYF